MGKKWANESRGLKFYAKGKDVYNREYHVQDGSWAMFRGVRIYCHDSTNEDHPVCLSLNEKEARRLIGGLEEFLEADNIRKEKE